MEAEVMGPPPRVRRAVQAAVYGVGLFLLSAVIGLVHFCVMVTGISLIGLGVGIFLVPVTAAAMRASNNQMRTLIGRWTGVTIESPYLPAPPRRGLAGWWDSTAHALTDRATWRDLLWMLTDPFVAAFTALLPAALMLNGAFGLLLAIGLWKPLAAMGDDPWYLFVPMTGWELAPLVAVLGLAQIKFGVLFAERLLTVYGKWCRLHLAPTEKARLALRVQQLTETRSVAVDTSAAELRRIERDLHDGAQARLVAMGMSLGAIEQLLDSDPGKARLLLAEARSTSAKALAELRDLVRGIHPPVLADRGLADAVRALALDHPLDVEVTTDGMGRLEAPVESAVYFAIAEMLTNAAKHAEAQRVWIDLRYEAGADGNGVLRASVTDDGRGGASLAGEGTGLRGIERRIGTFDGVLALNSPVGGPTLVTLELPCALSSPKTSLS